jgi:hypothetical protein
MYVGGIDWGMVCMGESAFYVAAYWSRGSRTAATNQTEQGPTLLLPEGEIRLAEGLKRMEDNGWRLIHIQANNPDERWHYPPHPERFYLFKKELERPET